MFAIYTPYTRTSTSLTPLWNCTIPILTTIILPLPNPVPITITIHHSCLCNNFPVFLNLQHYYNYYSLTSYIVINFKPFTTEHFPHFYFENVNSTCKYNTLLLPTERAFSFLNFSPPICVSK